MKKRKGSAIIARRTEGGGEGLAGSRCLMHDFLGSSGTSERTRFTAHGRISIVDLAYADLARPRGLSSEYTHHCIRKNRPWTK